MTIGKHLENGSPVKPSLQMQTATWFKTWQLASIPHDPGQGSSHFCRTHANSAGHSEFIVHSGRQYGGEPTYPGRHEHAGPLANNWHREWGPQGDGVQDGGRSVVTGISKIRKHFWLLQVSMLIRYRDRPKNKKTEFPYKNHFVYGCTLWT